tara:strand:- start:66 stop:1127 length:1062 start_codon:yes stop_codon:yes gene_type:complete
MAKFHSLIVTDVKNTIRDAIVVSLKSEDTVADFDFTQGQYLTFRQMIEGTEIRRSYSICAGKGEELKIGIKRVEGGAFSNWANDTLAPGMRVEAMPPMGSFYTAIEPEREKSYIGFAGGSGITPLLSILKTTLTSEPYSNFTLVYANRGVNTIMFKEDLEDLKNKFMGRLTILHILESDAQDIDLFQGRVDQEKCNLLFKHWIDISAVDTAFICGPEPMMLEIVNALRNHGLRDGQIKFELFASAQQGRLEQQKKAVVSSDKSTELGVTIDGTQRKIMMQAGQSVLDAALDSALDVPYACKAGVCSTCRCKVIKGQVEMIANHALEDYEIEQGYILACQSYPTSELVDVEFDH